MNANVIVIQLMRLHLNNISYSIARSTNSNIRTTINIIHMTTNMNIATENNNTTSVNVTNGATTTKITINMYNIITRINTIIIIILKPITNATTAVNCTAATNTTNSIATTTAMTLSHTTTTITSTDTITSNILVNVGNTTISSKAAATIIIHIFNIHNANMCLLTNCITTIILRLQPAWR